MSSSTPSAPSNPRIFVSHSHQDNPFCRPFVAHLRTALGVNDPTHIFYDERSLHAGDDWIQHIQQEVIARPFFIVILTPSAVASDFVRQETNLAIRLTTGDRQRRLFPLLVEPCDYDALAGFLGNYQLTDFARKDYDTAFADLVRAIRGGAAADGVPTPAAPGAPAASPQAERTRALTAEARAALAASDWSDAIARADFALSLPSNQDNLDLLTILARACAGAHQWTQARDAAIRALAHDPFAIALWLDLAAAQGALNQPTEALAALDRARAIVPRDDTKTRLELLTARSDLLVQQQQWPAALATLDDELTLAPGDPTRLGVKLDLLQHVGRAADALALARQLTARPDASAAWWLARARLARAVADDDAEVSAALDAAAHLAPHDPAIAQARTELFPSPIPAERFPTRLAELGFTPRKIGGVEVIVPPLCAVPAGEFLMGSDLKQDRDAAQFKDRETPQHRVALAAFQIARFPVTVAEHNCYLRAKGQAARAGNLDHPVVQVSWDDASAYAAWLAQQTGQPWRLPTEAEWEKAARWDAGAGHARIYPWGDAFDQSRANTIQGGHGRTTPVGSYLGGASPCGAQDLAGNVWEWTSTIYKPSPYNAGDGRERVDSTENRVLRGGSWNRLPALARAAYRLDLWLDLHDGGVGFRVVLAAPGS